MNTVQRILSISLLVSMLVAVPALAQEQTPQQRMISVSGEGTATAAPDQAVVRFGVVTRAEDPQVAREQNAQASREALNAVRELGVPEEDIRMETLRLQPYYERDPQTRERREVGYEAIRTVVVELDDIELVPSVVVQVVQRGANRIQGVHYDLDDRTPVRAEALRAAASDAREKAQLLAETLDASLGEVVQINEQSYHGPRPFERALEMAQADVGAAPEPEAYAPGEIEVSANVQVVFRLQ